MASELEPSSVPSTLAFVSRLSLSSDANEAPSLPGGGTRARAAPRATVAPLPLARALLPDVEHGGRGRRVVDEGPRVVAVERDGHDAHAERERVPGSHTCLHRLPPWVAQCLHWAGRKNSTSRSPYFSKRISAAGWPVTVPSPKTTSDEGASERARARRRDDRARRWRDGIGDTEGVERARAETRRRASGTTGRR